MEQLFVDAPLWELSDVFLGLDRGYVVLEGKPQRKCHFYHIMARIRAANMTDCCGC